ncbi:hypothetical protein [Okeania sp. SIO2B3]|uniref:hypothetical protein n=1 Tax=Okeania sp. SIO2B3 TaxID=2607784 RepID=UPI0013C1C0C5|nr:hypothetical protein [Okeania sp. SIO2B3]NET46177.1 hypothetical protein [Okeania sp. SIO2B3]
MLQIVGRFHATSVGHFSYQLSVIIRKKEEGRRKKEEGRRKKEEGRRGTFLKKMYINN